jgi:UDP-galactopyranose mutase
MAIDEYYDYEHGELPYRSIKFVTVPYLIPINDQKFPTPTVNFTTDRGGTRVTDWSLYPCESNTKLPVTIKEFTHEYPCDYKDNNNERFYPVKDIDGKNREIYEKYKAIKNDKVTFIGRCGLYAYLDMHQAVNSALQTADKFLLGDVK